MQACLVGIVAIGLDAGASWLALWPNGVCIAEPVDFKYCCCICCSFSIFTRFDDSDVV